MENLSDFNSATEGQNDNTINLDFVPWVFGPMGVIGILCNILIIITIARLEGKTSASGLAIQLLAFWDSMAILCDSVFEMVIAEMIGM